MGSRGFLGKEIQKIFVSSVFPYCTPCKSVQGIPWGSCKLEPTPSLGFEVRLNIIHWLGKYGLLRIHGCKGKSQNRGCCWIMLFNHWSCFMINIIFSSMYYACFSQNVCKLISYQHRWQEILNVGHWQLEDMLKFSAGRSCLTDKEMKGFTNGIIIVFGAKYIFIYLKT